MNEELMLVRMLARMGVWCNVGKGCGSNIVVSNGFGELLPRSRLPLVLLFE